jgi:hypothetical protein
MRTTADRAGDRPEDWEAPGAALVRSAAHPRQTSTTSLLVVALQTCGLDPSFANGVLVERPGQSASGDTHAA